MDERLVYLLEVLLPSGVLLFVLRFAFYWMETSKNRRFEKVFSNSSNIAETLSSLRKELGASRAMLNSTHNGDGFPVVGKNLYLSVINESISDSVDVFPVKSYLQNWLLDDLFLSMITDTITKPEEIITFNKGEIDSKTSMYRMTKHIFEVDKIIFANIGQKYNRYYYISISWSESDPPTEAQLAHVDFYVKSAQTKIRELLETGHNNWFNKFVYWIRSKLMP